MKKHKYNLLGFAPLPGYRWLKYDEKMHDVDVFINLIATNGPFIDFVRECEIIEGVPIYNGQKAFGYCRKI